ncbi:MAG: DUF3526 domain-containing protein [Burkholderiales bacterium]|nr:DUF3526 domain-containing protein [Burkholderiales bacterium]
MGSQTSLLREVVRHEARVLVADRSLLLAGLFLALLIGYALYNGLTDTRARDLAIAEVLQQDDQRIENTIAQLRRVMAGQELPDPFANPADASSVGRSMGARHTAMLSAPLAPIAFGQSDMLPGYYMVSVRSKVNFMYDSEIENPWNLFSGRFDLAFVLTYLLPLLILSVSYNLLAAEREQGTLRMLLSQPLGLPTLVFGKIAVRAGALRGIALIVPVAGWLLTRPETRAADQLVMLLIWAALVIAYGLFWFALSGLVNSLGKSSALNALILIGCWIVLVLVVPLALNLLVSAVSPAPSRTELATQTRIIASDSYTRNQDLLRTEYYHVGKPESLLPKDGRFEVPARLKAFFLMARQMDAEIQAALDRFDEQLAKQQRLVNRYGFASPAILMHEGMTVLAGTGVSRYQHFQEQVQAFHGQWREYFEPRIIEGIAITEADFETMPQWTWKEQDPGVVRSDALLRTFHMVIAAVLLTILCIGKLRRYPVV